MVTDRPLRALLDEVEARKPVTYSRWGKNEWQVLFGDRGGYIPRDGHFYFPDLCRDMTQLILSRPKYHMGIPPDLLTQHGDRIDAYLCGLGLDDLNWYNDLFSVTRADQIQQVLGTVSRVPLLLVGPPRLRRLRKLLGFKSFVDVPPRNQYLCVSDITRSVLAALEDFKTPTLVSLSAGVASPLIIAALHKRVGTFHQLIDVGRLWEPFVRGRT